MSGKQMQVRRGGLQGNRASSRDTIASNQVSSSNRTRVCDTTTLAGSTQAPRVQQQSSQQRQQPSSSQQQHLASHSSGSHQELPEKQDLVEDPPSGEDLPNVFWGAPDTQILEDDHANSELVDPGAIEGRNITQAPIWQKKRALRINITVDENGVFEGKGANKVIAHRMKYFFNPNYKNWENVPKSHRELLWKEFRMACRWEPELQDIIVRQWIRVNRKKYNVMMYKAKSTSEHGIRPK